MNLIYVGDAMCSWCYGFAKPLDDLLADPQDAAPLQLALVMGGLRPFTTEPISPERAERTGRPLAPRGGGERPAVRAGAEHRAAPARLRLRHRAGARATVTVRTLWPQQVWRYFKAVQHAFYADARNVVDPAVLADIAVELGLPRAEFGKAFASQKMRDLTMQDFQQSQAWGIRGFPTLVAEHGDHLHLVGSGFMPIDTLRERLSGAASAHDHDHDHDHH